MLFFLPFQKYEVEFLLQQQWYDPRLRYANQSQYEYLNAIHHHEEIWLPDTYFIMHGDFKDPIIPMHFALRIYRNGTINYLMRFAFKCFFCIHTTTIFQNRINHLWFESQIYSKWWRFARSSGQKNIHNALVGASGLSSLIFHWFERMSQM